MSVALIKKDEAEQTDPLRAALEVERDALAAIDTCRENLEKGGRALDAVRADLDSARNLVERARERDGRAAAASIRKSASAPADASKTVRGARLRAQELEDDVEIAEAAIGRLQDDLAQAEAALRQAVVDRLEAVNAALAPIARALVGRAREAARDLAVAKALLLVLLNDLSRGAPDFSDDALAGMRARQRIAEPLAGLRAEAEAATGRSSNVEERGAVEAALAAMQSFVAKLAVDATAELPAIP
jgi:chromosome segregation ATPase